MLDATLKTQLKAYLERITQPIELVASLDDSAKSREMQELLRGDRRACRTRSRCRARRDDDARKPSFAIHRAGTDIGVRFAGLPDGPRIHLAGARAAAGRRPPAARKRRRRSSRSRRSTATITFETYFSLSCQNCPDVVQALNLMSVLNPRIRHVADRRRAVPGRGRGAPGHGRARRSS